MRPAPAQALLDSPAMEGDPGVVRPEFGPSLPALLRTRLRPRITSAVLLAVVAVLGFLFVTRGHWADPRAEITHRGEPAFRIAYPDDRMRRAAPQADELARIVGRRPSLALTLTVRRFTPESPLDVAPFGALPLYGGDHIGRLRASLPGFDLRDERHLRVNWVPGYDIRFRYAPRMYGRDTIVFPEENSRTGAVLLSLRHRIPRGGDAAAAREDLAEAHRALRSFAFGLD